MTRSAEADRGFLAGWKGAFLFALLGALVGTGAVMLFGGQLVRGYILDNPEILPEAMERLQQRKAASAIDANREALETPFAGAWAGAEDGDVVLVEFFDYACGYCRKSNADVDRLLAEDKKLKVVWREWPVLGPDSEAAAQLSLAAAKAGKFVPFYKQMFAAGRPSAETLQAARQALVLSGPLPPPEAAPELQKNFQLAQALEGDGTPLFVVGDTILHGAVGYQALKEAIAEARERS
jgi:protein-disulfide isomerase